MNYKDKVILVTGGTGSIGSSIVRKLLEQEPRQIRILSRDESKQYNLFHELGSDQRVRLLIGDVRDQDRVNMAMENVDIVFHAAAMKHVGACENDPFEAVKTNVLGTQNVIHAAMNNGVERVIGISTDKATDPVSVMGSTKLLAERIMLASHFYSGGGRKTKICFVRFGNVLSTRGSVVPHFYKQIKNGNPVTVTDTDMVRFFMSIEDAINLVFKAAETMSDREIFVLKMPVMKITDLAQAMIELYSDAGKKVDIKIVGRRNGERLDEKLLTSDEAMYALENEEMFIITPVIGSEHRKPAEFIGAHKTTSKGYSTEGKEVLSVDEIKKLLKKDEKNMMRVLGMS